MSRVKVGRANEKTVKELLDRLIETYEKFINEQPKEVPFIDGFMAAHNFHAMIVLHLEHETNSSGLWIKLAADTFADRMRREECAVNKSIGPYSLAYWTAKS